MEQYSKGKYEAYASSCLNGQKASCICACPFNLDVRTFIGKIKIKSFSAAYRLYRNQVVFPEIVHRLCPAPCRKACVLGDGYIDLPRLEEACIRAMRDKAPNRYNMPQKPQSIAIIGAGLSGLACAQKLSSKSYDVTVYEKSASIGGCLWELMPPEEFMADIETQFRFAKYQLRTGSAVAALNELQCDAVYIATGRNGMDFGLAEGAHAPSLSTRRPGVFLGGRLIGASDMEAIMQGAIAAASIEKYLLTGRMGGIEQSFHQSEMGFEFPVKTGNAAPPVRPAASSYTAEEAIEEAGRCLLCDCTACRDHCELLQSVGKLPKRLVDDALVSLFPVAGLEGQRIATRTIASCQQCGTCAHSCPESIDMELFYRDFRHLLVQDKTFPAAFHDYFIRDMAFSGGGEFYMAREAPDGKRSGYVFFPGCQLGGSNPEYVAKAYRYLLDRLPGTALMLACCGIPAEWAGEKEMLDAHLSKLRRDWERLGGPTLIWACPTCRKAFARFLPEAECVSFYEIIERLGLPEGCGVAQKTAAAVYDPCASRDYPLAQQSVRRLAESAGYSLVELESSGDNAKCCSYGGHTHLANPRLVDTVTKKRIGESDVPYITYCANCRDTFAAAGKDCRHMLDIVWDLMPSQGKPNRSKSRLNRRSLKPMLLKEFWRERAEPPEDSGRVLKMSGELREKLSASFILEEDILRTIREAEASGRIARDEASGVCHAHLEIGAITYWARYSALEDGSYLLHGAYSHRMEIEE